MKQQLISQNLSVNHPGETESFPAQNLGPKMCGEGKIEGDRGDEGSVVSVRKQG